MTTGPRIPLNSRGYPVAAGLGVAAMAAAVVWLGWRADWLGFAISLLFLVASVTFMATPSRFPALFDVLFVIAALANGGGWVWELYSNVIAYDEVVHAYTTFAGSLSLGFALYYSARAHLRTVVFGIAIVTMGIAGGAVWEIIEWSLINVQDSVSDLIVDSVGAIIAGILGTWILKLEARDNHNGSP